MALRFFHYQVPCMSSRSVFIALLACAALSACGGGGSDTPVNPPDAPDTSVIEGTTARFETTSLSFGYADVGRSVTKTVTLYNDGTAAADFSLMDNLPASYRVSGCESVPAGGSCVLSVTFHPTSNGRRSGTDIAPTRADSITNRLSVTGLGIDACGMSVPDGTAGQVSAQATQTICP